MYTTKLSKIVSNYSNYHLSFIERIQYARPHIFDFEYLDDQEFKDHFERLFLIHFNDSEIAFETVEQWKLRLYEYTLSYVPVAYQKYKLLQNINNDSFLNVTETEQEATNESNTKSMGSTFPKELLEADSVSNVKYASSGSIGDASSTATGKSKTKSGSVLDKVETFDKLFNDFWQDLLNKFNPLFLGIY